MNNRERKNKSGGAAMPALLGIIFAISALSEGVVSSPAVGVIVLILVVLLIFAAVFFVGKKLLKAAEVKGAGPKKPLFKREELEDKPISASRGYSAQNGAVYNERSAEELFRRDQERRIKQLDVFLKNGIIEKNEYNLLRQRYEKISYERN